MRKFKFSLSIGYSNAKREETLEFDEDPENPMSDADIDQALQEWTANFIDSNWREL